MIGPVESGTAGLLPDYIALLGVCTMSEKPAVKDGQIQIRKMMNVILAFDHRAMMGNTPIEFLTQLKRNLEDPTTYLI
jgi:pyruvate/2-oxoglutarate dehydrogenase complex dihydrolipoamide acyltransferase (E2) component